MRFRAKKNFWSDQFRSAYVAGLEYTVRPDNRALAAAVSEWITAGLVEEIRAESGTQPASVAGDGTVT